MSATSCTHLPRCDGYDAPNRAQEDETLIALNEKSLTYLQDKVESDLSSAQLWAKRGLEDCGFELEGFCDDEGEPEAVSAKYVFPSIVANG